MKSRSVITCPECGFKKEEIIPVDSCQHMYKCSNCDAILKAKNGDCCIFCSFGSDKCPAMRKKKNH